MSNADSPDAQASTPAPPAARALEPSGIGGWLILPLAHLVLAVGRILFDVVNGAVEGWREGGGGTFDPEFSDVALIWERLTGPEQYAVSFTAFCLLVVLYALFCLVQFLRKKRSAPDLMIGFYLLLGAMMMTNYLLLANFPVLWRSSSEMWGALTGLIRVAIAMAIWIPYFIVSVRVKNTFVR